MTRMLRLALARVAAGKSINPTARETLLDQGLIEHTEDGLKLTSKGTSHLKGHTK